jgi:RNA polymerase sigma-70 factor (sigma-E family)
VGDEKISPRDADELAACFTAHARDLFGYACVLARGDRALADDLVQAAFEAAGGAWWMLRCLTDGQRRGWLRKTLANIAVSGFRRDAAFRERLPRIEARYRKARADTAPGAPEADRAARAALPPICPRRRGGAIVMTTGGSGTGNSREDELLSRLYEQVTELLASRFGAGYEVAAGLDRFGTWLRQHTTEDQTGLEAVQASSQVALGTSPGMLSAAAISAAGPGDAVIANRLGRGPEDIRSEVPEGWADRHPDREMTALYEDHYSSLVRLAALLVGDMAAAEEIVQDSFVALCHARQRPGGDSALSYLRRFVVNRSRSVLPHRADKNAPGATPATPGAQRGAMAAPEYPAVISALRALPARQRAVLVLRYYADLSEAQVAEVMGISKGAVGRHTARATASLRAVLDGEHE